MEDDSIHLNRNSWRDGRLVVAVRRHENVSGVTSALRNRHGVMAAAYGGRLEASSMAPLDALIW